MEKALLEMLKIMEIKNFFLLLTLLAGISANSQTVNLIICESNNQISKSVNFEIVNEDSNRSYIFNKPYVVNIAGDNYKIIYRGKSFSLSNIKLGTEYRTIYLNFLENKKKSYLVYEIHNGFTVKKELIQIDANACSDEIYLIDKRVEKFNPTEKLINKECIN